MFFKRKKRNKVYGLYLRGVSIESISSEMDLSVDDIDEIIDYMNEIYV
jgi:hypothetical protein